MSIPLLQPPPYPLAFHKPLNPPNSRRRRSFLPSPSILRLRCLASDEFPVNDDDAFLSSFTPKDNLSEDEARRLNWIDRGWAPWEEILSPEGYFARLSLNEGEEVPLRSPEAIEAFRLLTPSYRRQKMLESGLSEDEWYLNQFRTKGEIPDRLTTFWAGPLVARPVPPRDWPPRGWDVDPEELSFIRECHLMASERVDLDVDDLDRKVRTGKDADNPSLDRYKMFLKQYNEWVDFNKDRLEEESYEVPPSFVVLFSRPVFDAFTELK